MSRIGRKIISTKSLKKLNFVNEKLFIKGNIGECKIEINNKIILKINKKFIIVSVFMKSRKSAQLWGLTRSLIYNAIIGTTKGFNKKLEIHGIGYKSKLQNIKILLLNIGYSHEVIYFIPEFVDVKCLGNIIEIFSCNKQLVGQVASDIRNIKSPEPYKGKGIRYKDELVIIKEGKKK